MEIAIGIIIVLVVVLVCFVSLARHAIRRAQEIEKQLRIANRACEMKDELLVAHRKMLTKETNRATFFEQQSKLYKSQMEATQCDYDALLKDYEKMKNEE